MKKRKIIVFSNGTHSAVQRDIALLETMGYAVKRIISQPHTALPLFLGNRIREFFLCLFYLPRASAVVCWFNDYHAFFPIVFSKVFFKPSLLIVGGYDAVTNQSLKYGIFYKKNLRQWMARKNYAWVKQIWVVHQSLAVGCKTALQNSGTLSGIHFFIPRLKTPVNTVPTAYDAAFWHCSTAKTPKTVLTVAHIPDQRTLKIKGIPLFLNLAKRLPDFQFTLAGIAPQLLDEREVPPNLTVLGKQSPLELKFLYSQHQYYFQGSENEGLPNVLCEAMLCKCIPMGHAVFGIPDAIGDTGLLFDNPLNLNPLVAFLVNQEKINGEAARTRIIERYPVEKRQDAFEHFIHPTV